MRSSDNRKRSPVKTIAALLIGVLALVGCGSGGGSESASPPEETSTSTDEPTSSGTQAAGDLPATITITTIRNLTGAVAPYGEATLSGSELAVQEINDSGFLGESRIELNVVDVATDVQQAVDAMTQAAASDATLVISPVFSTQVLGMVPIAQREGVPMVVVQAGVPGVVETGDYIFRITPPQDTLVDKTVGCLEAKEVGSVAMIYQAFNATIAALAEDTFPSQFESAGIEVVVNEGYPQGTDDFSAIVSRVLDRSPDAIGVLPSNDDVTSIMTQLQRQGFEGQIFGQAGIGAPGLLDPVSDYAEGTIWATDFSPDLSFESSRDFVEAWSSENEEAANNFHAEAYDAVWFAARAIKAAGTADRAAVRDGLEQVASEGFDGALGPIEFEGRDARVEGVLLEWRDGGAQLASAPCD